MNKKRQTLRTKIYILSFIALLAISFQATAQTLPPWTVTATADTQEIVLFTPNTTVTYDGSYNTIGDAVGVFYDFSGTLICAGYLVLDGVNNKITVYGDTGGDNGYQDGELFHIRYWRQGKECIIDTPDVIINNNAYSHLGSDTIYSLTVMPKEASYPSDYYCVNFPEIIPLTLTGISFGQVIFDIQPAGFDGINPGDGSIEDLNSILPNSYKIHVSTTNDVCFRDDTIRITVSNYLFSNPEVTVHQPTCSERSGRIDVDTASLLHGAQTSLIELRDRSTNESTFSPSGKFNDLAPGRYQLILRDAYSCADTINYTINGIPQGCDDFILAPLQNGEFSEILLPWEGQTKIYNSQGLLMHTLTTPAKWDGRDQNGQYVKNGVYFIFTEGEKRMEITVIY